MSPYTRHLGVSQARRLMALMCLCAYTHVSVCLHSCVCVPTLMCLCAYTHVSVCLHMGLWRALRQREALGGTHLQIRRLPAERKAPHGGSRHIAQGLASRLDSEATLSREPGGYSSRPRHARDTPYHYSHEPPAHEPRLTALQHTATHCNTL